LRPPSESPRQSQSRGSSPPSRVGSRERGSSPSPEPFRETSREDTLRSNAASLSRVLTAACCNEDDRPSEVSHDINGSIRPLRPHSELLRTPVSDTSSLVTLHAVLPGPDEDALQRAFLFADNGPLDDNSFLDELGLSLDRETDG
jgi:hypothetical protein